MSVSEVDALIVASEPLTLCSVQHPLRGAVNYEPSNSLSPSQGYLLLSDQSGAYEASCRVCRSTNINAVSPSHESRLHGGLEAFRTPLCPVCLQTPERIKQCQQLYL